MRVKKIKIGIKDLKTALEDFVKTGEAIERGEKVKKESGVYFTSFVAFRKVLTPKRLELLHTIKTRKPSSIHELARMAKRDVKNVADDVKYLEQIGLIEKKETDHKTAPVTKYDRIALEIAV
ncbi:MAG: MarR family transcriptional regulator [Nitrospirae bacterium]|nr:MAG: MarR family transcriptional regulator [Nitrospirota bacterium]